MWKQLLLSSSLSTIFATTSIDIFPSWLPLSTWSSLLNIFSHICLSLLSKIATFSSAISGLMMSAFSSSLLPVLSLSWVVHVFPVFSMPTVEHSVFSYLFSPHWIFIGYFCSNFLSPCDDHFLKKSFTTLILSLTNLIRFSDCFYTSAIFNTFYRTAFSLPAKWFSAK